MSCYDRNEYNPYMVPPGGRQLIPGPQGPRGEAGAGALELKGDDGASLVGYKRGTGAAATTVKQKLSETVSVKDFGAKGDGVAQDGAAIQAAVAYAGTLVTEGLTATVFVPNGIYLVDYVGVQGVTLRGESRAGTIIRSVSGGTAAVIDAGYSRAGAVNTQGHCLVENLTVDAAGTSRPGVKLYGGSCILRNVEVYGSAQNGVVVQYTLMSLLENVTSRNNGGDGVVVNVDPLHFGDVNTSLMMTNVWARDNTRYGFNVASVFYSTFVNCCSQANGNTGWRLNGVDNGVNSMNAISMISCASENDGGGAFSLRKLRNFTMQNPFVLALADQNTITLDDCIGEISGFTDFQTHTGGTQSLRILNAPALGLALVSGGDFKMAPDDMKFCSFRGAVVNGGIRNTLNNLTVNDPNFISTMDIRTTPLGADFGGLGVYAADGSRVLFVSRAGATVIGAARGELVDKSGLINGDIHMYTLGTNLKFTVKGLDGVIRTATLPLT